jgi:2-C-methyl-D-erythritol 2,4-cyclodiphosphate synthase
MTTDFRVGVGHDTHRLVDGGPLRLGGVDIQFDRHLEGHSDADVLLHAITDAILGAACLGDIGEMFPNTDPKNRGLDSVEILAAAIDRVIGIGWKIENLDCVVHAEAPKIIEHRERIQKRISEILVLRTDQVSIKGKTGEGVGSVGQGLVIQAQCVCLLRRIEKRQNDFGGIGF